MNDTDKFETLLKEIAVYNLPLCIDSRKAVPGSVFVAIPGTHANGAVYIADAIRHGAATIVCLPEDASSVTDAKVIAVRNPRLAAARLATAKWDTASLPFSLVGVTGTNGKTTCTYLLEHLFISTNKPAGVIGTIAIRWPNYSMPASMTTPDIPELHSILASMRNAGVQAAAMEVSSHALDQDRVACIPFSSAVFTNLTQDHLDYHKTFEAYYLAKARLFLEMPKSNKAAAVGTDGAWGRRLAAELAASSADASRLITFGLQPFSPVSGARHLTGTILKNDTKGLQLAMTLSDSQHILESWQIVSPLVGAFNAENLLAVQAAALSLGFIPEQFSCFTHFCGVPGRLERIPHPAGLDIFVDYAHTPDALTNVLSALRNSGFKRIVCVFGCGGDRDRTKRPLMGKAVADGADAAVLTSANPRTEDPESIIKDVLPGLSNSHFFLIEPDRREAIRKALALLTPGDALLVAGKGHETTQTIGTTKYPFSDQQTLRELFQ